MYTALKELNNSGDYYNAASAWAAFVNLRAENCKTVREFLGKFREAVNEIAQQGITIAWKKLSITLTTPVDNVN
jgi:hypothetical protein